jgi:uncharacterized protein YggT (Ycf19 family)
MSANEVRGLGTGGTESPAVHPFGGMRGATGAGWLATMSDGPKEHLVWAGRALVYLVYFFVTVALIVLAFGFFLLLFGANPDAAFAEWVYRSLDRVMAPFRGLFEPIQLNGQSVLDVSVLFAMIVYGILAIALRSLIDWLTYRVDLIRRREAQAAATSQTAPLPTVAQAPPLQTAPPSS